MFKPKKTFFSILLVALMTAASVVCSQQTEHAPPKPMVPKAGFDPERLARIPARMKEFVEKGTISGTVTLIARHGVVGSLEAVGYQDLETNKPMRTDTIFQIRSMTKSVTAVGVMILVEEGRLTLRDPLEKYLPEFRALSVIESRESQSAPVLKPASRPVTIYDLLTHTSGMSSWLAEHLRAEARQKQTLAELAALRARMPLEFQPGTKFLYSNSGYRVLGRLIEVVSGQPYEKFTEERVFKPLGMKDSSVLPPLEKLDRVASTYELRDGKLVKSQNYDISSVQRWKIPAPSASMFSTASDLFAFYQMMLNGGQFNGRRILSPASVEVMTMCHTSGVDSLSPRRSSGIHYGLGWNVVCDPGGTQELRSIGSFGHGGLLNTNGWVDPQKHLVTVFLSSRVPTAEEWRTTILRDEARSFWALAAAAIVD